MPGMYVLDHDRMIQCSFIRSPGAKTIPLPTYVWFAKTMRARCINIRGPPCQPTRSCKARFENQSL